MTEQKKFKNIITDAVSDRDSNKRLMTFVISNERVNRYGHVVKVDGWNLKEYKLNPILLIDHNANSENVVGKASRIWVDKKNRTLKGTFEFVPEGISAKADLMWQLYDNDFLNSVSAGYSVDYSKVESPKKDGDPIVFNGQTLYEVSLTPLPANIDARKEMFTNAFELGIIDEELVNKAGFNLDDEATNNVDVIEDSDNSINPEQTIKTTAESESTNNVVEEDPYKWFFDAFDEIKSEKNIEEILKESKANEDCQNQSGSTDDLTSSLITALKDEIKKNNQEEV